MYEFISSKEKAINAIREYKEDLLKEFLNKAKTVSKDLENLNKLGYDEKRNVRIEGKTNVNGKCFNEVNQSMLCDIIAVLRDMKDKNGAEAIKMFEKAYTVDVEANLYKYNELEEMSDLAFTYTNTQYMENLL